MTDSTPTSHPKTKVFAIYDAAAGVFTRFFSASTGKVAQRIFGDSALEPTNPMTLHPYDFVLYEVAEFDQALGRFEPYDLNENLGNLATLMETPDVNP